MDINTIAQMAGVSRATVSRYLNDGYVSQEKRAAIKRVIDQTGYVPSRQAKTPAHRQDRRRGASSSPRSIPLPSRAWWRASRRS